MGITQKEIELRQIKKRLKSLRYQNMNHAKSAIAFLAGFTFPTMNQLLQFSGEKPLPFGDNYAWVNIGWDVLSNKYGAAAIYHQDTKKTEFVLYLPSPKPLLEIKPKEIEP